eukprot:s449_g22.t1
MLNSVDKVSCPVLKAWLGLPFLCSRAADGKLAHVLKDTIDRQTVADNAEMLEPVIAEFGDASAEPADPDDAPADIDLGEGGESEDALTDDEERAGGETTVITAKRPREDDAALGREGPVVAREEGVGSGGDSAHVEVKPDTTATEPDTSTATSNPQPPSQKLKDFWGKYVVPKNGPADTSSKEPEHDKAEATNNTDTTEPADKATESSTGSENSNIPNKDGEATGSIDRTDADATHTTPLPKPAAIDTEPCISPQEQTEQMHNDPKPKRGRPSKKTIAAKAKAKAKATAKAKAKSKGSDSKSAKVDKPTAKGKAKAKSSKGKRKAAVAEDEVAEDVHETCEEEHEEEHEEESGPEPDSTARSSTDANVPKSKATKRKSKATTKGKRKSSKAKKDQETIEHAATPSSKANTKNKKAAKADTKGKESPGSAKRKPQEKTPEYKALLSRKSCAYKKARGEARKAGLSEEEILKAAKKARHACVLVQKKLA